MKSMTVRGVAVSFACAAAVQAAVLTPPANDGFILFPVIVLLCPFASGIIAQALGRSWRPVAATWALSGVVMFFGDWAFARWFPDHMGNQVFHLVLGVVMAGLTALGALMTKLVYRRRPARDATPHR